MYILISVFYFSFEEMYLFPYQKLSYLNESNVKSHYTRGMDSFGLTCVCQHVPLVNKKAKQYVAGGLYY